MSTPATLKKIEEAKLKAQQRKINNDSNEAKVPLTNLKNNFNVGYF